VKHARYTVVKIPGSSTIHIIPITLEPGASLTNWDSLCGIPCGLGAVLTEAGNGVFVCKVCASKADERGLL